MPEYHGDVIYRVGRVYESRDEGNYVIAIILLLFFGSTGMHRFYLNDTRIGWMYFTPFAVSALIGVAVLDFTLLVWDIGIAGIFLFGELIYFVYRRCSR